MATRVRGRRKAARRCAAIVRLRAEMVACREAVARLGARLDRLEALERRSAEEERPGLILAKIREENPGIALPM